MFHKPLNGGAISSHRASLQGNEHPLTCAAYDGLREFVESKESK